MEVLRAFGYNGLTALGYIAATVEVSVPRRFPRILTEISSCRRILKSFISIVWQIRWIGSRMQTIRSRGLSIIFHFSTNSIIGDSWWKFECYNFRTLFPSGKSARDSAFAQPVRASPHNLSGLRVSVGELYVRIPRITDSPCRGVDAFRVLPSPTAIASIYSSYYSCCGVLSICVFCIISSDLVNGAFH